MPRFKKPKKLPFDDLDPGYVSAARSADEATLKRLVNETSLGHAALMEAKEKDPDLKEKKESLKMAGEVYRDGTKHHKLRMKLLRQCLSDQGKDPDGSYDPSKSPQEQPK